MNQTSQTQFDSNPIEQKAYVHAFQGRGQLVRDGFFLPVEVGMELQPGDRISAYEDSRAEITFTGVSTKLVLANGSSATLNMQVSDPAQGPQWVASNLYGTKVFFEEGASPVQLAATDAVSMPAEEAKPNPETKPEVDLDTPGSSSMMGLFTYENGPAAKSGSFPVMETVAGVAGVALIAGGVSTDDDDDTTLTTASEAGFSNGTASGNSGTDTGSGTNSGAASGSTGGGDSGDGDSGNGDAAPSTENPLDMLLAATPLDAALAPITSAAGLEALTGMLPI